MKCFKGILALVASFVLVSGVFADNKTDEIEKQVRELKAKVNSLEDLSTTLAAEDKVNPFLTVSGYIEMSIGQAEWEEDDEGDDADTTWMDVGIVEFVFDFDFSDNLSASIHIESAKDFPFRDDGFSDDPDDGDTDYSDSLSTPEIEEAWFKWNFSQVEGLSLKAGIQDSAVGLEASEAVDLYQWSNAQYYAGYNSGHNNEGQGIPTYVSGLTLAYETEQFYGSIGVYDGLGLKETGDPIGDGNIDEFGFILKLGAKIGENGTIQFAYGQEDEDEEDGGDNSTEFWNIWATYTIGQFEVAAEYLQMEEDDTDEDMMGYILRGTWNINDKWSLTVRYDYIEQDDDDHNADTIIISPAYKVSDNLLILAEIGMRDGEQHNGSDDLEHDWFVIEAFLTF